MKTDIHLVRYSKNRATMESAAIKSLKDNKILNKDDSVTNKDDESSSVKPTNVIEQEKNQGDTITPANDSPDLYEEAAVSSNKGQGPAGENL